MNRPEKTPPTEQDYTTAYARLLDPAREAALPNNREKVWVKLEDDAGNPGTPILRAGISLRTTVKPRCYFEPGGKEGPIMSRADLETVREKLRANPKLAEQCAQR